MPKIARLASADYGINLAYQSIEMFLLFFYTEAMGLSPLFAGFVLTMGSVWDALCDPAIGALADRTRTRWGRFKPWVLASGPLIGAGLILTFTKPDLEGTTLAAFALAAHLVFRTAYTMGAVPFIALSARVTRRPGDRAAISSFRMQFAGLAALTTSFLFGYTREHFGMDGEAQGFFVGAIVLSLVIPSCFLFAMRSVVEAPEVEQARPADDKRHDARGDLAILWKMLTHNPYLIRVILATVLVSMAATLVSKVSLYYYKYYAQAPEMGSYALALSATAQLLLAPLWAWLAIRTSKRTGWFVAAGCGIVGLVSVCLIPTGHPYAALSFFFLFGAANTGLSVMFWSMIPDTVEVNELLLGDRAEAKTIGMAMFARKMTLAINALLVGAVLELAGFTPNTVPSGDVLSALRLLIGGVPLLCLVLSLVVLWNYRLDAREHARICEELERRQQ